MTEIEAKAIEILRSYPEGLRASDLGWELWGDGEAGQRIKARGAARFCRPAGKLLKKLRASQNVYPMLRSKCTLWRATILD